MATEQRGAIFRSASLVIHDVRCHLHHETPGPEECRDSHDIVRVRSGLFTRRSGRDVVAGDPNHVMLFTRHEPYRIARPARGATRARRSRYGPTISWTPSGATRRPMPSVRIKALVVQEVAV
jgi:hypothetical protein